MGGFGQQQFQPQLQPQMGGFGQQQQSPLSLLGIR
jgi:hypothetical protein